MSWQFINDGSQRVTEKETLTIREELIELLSLSKDDFNLGLNPDFYWHKNLLLPNPIKEKLDNWDIDIFLFYSLAKKTPEVFIKLLNQSSDVLKTNKNDHTWSILYNSKKTGKKVQIDLHIIQDSHKNRENYFEYYRVPYLYFILWMIFNKVNIRLWINWISYWVEEQMWVDWTNSKVSKHFLLDKTFPNFLQWILNFNLDTIKNISSYNEISNFLVSQGLSDYSFFKDHSQIRWDYKKKLNWNDKLQFIIDSLPSPTKTIDEFKVDFTKKLLNKYPFITQRKEAIISWYLKSQETAKERRELLQKLYSVTNLGELSVEQKKQIPLFTKVINELNILHEMSKIIKTKYPDENIYLVWGAVRDILLWLWNNDWDLSWSLLPEEFISFFWGTSTEKYGTVFTTYKWLEIEYTPFRSEEGYSGRQIDKIVFSKKLEVDAVRRDFTINSLYLDLNNLKIIDLYNWQEDLQKWIIKAVWSPYERFKEDHLRILRALRLASKLSYTIDWETYSAMIKMSNWLDSLSEERIVDEYFKWLNLKNQKWREYLLILDKFNKDSKRLSDVLETYKTLWHSEIYTFIIYLLGKDITKLLRLSWSNRGQTFDIIVKIHTKKYPEHIEKLLNNLDSLELSDVIKILFYSKLEWMNAGYLKSFFNWLVNKYILVNKYSRKTLHKLLRDLHYILENKYKFTYWDIKKELGILDPVDYCEKQGIWLSDLNEHLLDKYFQFIWLKIKKEVLELPEFSISDTELNLDSEKYYSIFSNTDVDIVRYDNSYYQLLQKWNTQLISFYKKVNNKLICEYKNLKQGKEVEDLIEKYFKKRKN